MKMGHTLFWGLLLIILGLALIFRIVFNLDFPIFKIFIAFILIYLGIKILLGSFGPKISSGDSNEKDTIFGERQFSSFDKTGQYSTVFGKSIYDFRNYDLQGEIRHFKITTVFGATEIRLDKDMPIKIQAESAFSGVSLPNGNSSVFGSAKYESPAFSEDKPYLDLKLEAVFGGMEVLTY